MQGDPGQRGAQGPRGEPGSRGAMVSKTDAPSYYVVRRIYVYICGSPTKKNQIPLYTTTGGQSVTGVYLVPYLRTAVLD